VDLLGRNGLINSALVSTGIVSQPVEWLLYSDFAVVWAMVHLYTLFMVTPIFNTLMRIDRSLVEAARDAGANGAQILWNVIIPLAKPGMAIGTIFVVTLVMADFSTVQIMSGGQSASVALMMKNQMSLLQYPAAAANAVVLLVLVLLMVAGILRVVDIRKELEPWTGKTRPGSTCLPPQPSLRDLPLRSAYDDRLAVVPGAEWRADLSDERRLAPLVRQPIREAGGRRFRRLVPALADPRRDGDGRHRRRFAARRARLPPPLPRLDRALLSHSLGHVPSILITLASGWGSSSRA
jgi:ABC-type molybdate transport system permease subunit